MKRISVLFILLGLTGCGNETIERVVQVTAPPASAVVVDQISQVVSEENAYRVAAGQLPLTPGLTCTLHNLIATTPASIPASPPSAVATFTYVGSFNQTNSSASSGLNILPASLRPLYTQWFLVRCQGQIVVTDSAYEAFYLSSDDGTNLYIDGSLVVANDGNHSVQTRSGSRLLKRGVHTFRLDYMQANGNQALILENSNGIVSGSRFYR